MAVYGVSIVMTVLDLALMIGLAVHVGRQVYRMGIEHVDRERIMDITTQTGKYLTFLTGGEGYGLPVLKVREIMKVMDITSIPQVPAYVRGVINLRGKVIPVIDLRLKFGMPACDPTDQTCIIVVEASASDRKAMMGLLVDGVSEVLNIQASEIEQPPAFGDGVRTDYMQGVAKVKGTVKILLDIDRVLTGNEFDILAA